MECVDWESMSGDRVKGRQDVKAPMGVGGPPGWMEPIESSVEMVTSLEISAA